jgi:hypothetical protein
MTRTPIPDIETSASKPVTNYDRLLAVLEANAERASEPELIRRLRDALRIIRSASGPRHDA